MAEVPNGAKVHKAVYKSGGLDEEMDATLPFRGSEEVLCEGAVTDARLRGLIQRPVYLRLSTSRLCLLLHYATRPDRIIEANRTHVDRVSLSPRGLVEVSVQIVDGRRDFRFGPCRRRQLPITPRLSIGVEELESRLRDWLGS